MTDLNSLQIFIKVAELGNMSRAARLLKMPKSTVSRHLSTLEKELGTQLLYRTTNKLSLTSQGIEIFASCQESLASVESALSTALARSNGLSGCLRLTAPEDMGTLLLTPIIGEFCRIHPSVSMHLIYNSERIDLVRDNVDLALRVGSCREKMYRIRKVGTVKGVLVAAPSFLKKVGESDLSSMDIQNLPFFAFGNAGVFRDVVLQNGAKQKRLKLAPRISSGSMTGLYQLALAGLGIALIPDFVCSEALEDGRLLNILNGWHTDVKPVSFVTPPRQKLPSLVNTFIDFAAPRLNQAFLR